MSRQNSLRKAPLNGQVSEAKCLFDSMMAITSLLMDSSRRKFTVNNTSGKKRSVCLARFFRIPPAEKLRPVWSHYVDVLETDRNR